MKGRKRKGQSVLAKPIVLVMIIALLSFLIFFMLQQEGSLEKRSSKLNLLSTTSNTLSLLTHSPRCLAYQPEEGGAYGTTVAADKLREFEIEYSTSEPLCARNFVYGWRAQVKDLITDRTWQFGAQDFSQERALKGSETRRMPISIHYSSNRVNPGEIRLTMVNGDLERIGEKLNYLCASGAAKGRVSFYNSYPAEVKSDSICMAFSNNQSCRPLLCQVEMPAVDSKGQHLMQVNIKGRRERTTGTSGISLTDKSAQEIILRASDLPAGSDMKVDHSDGQLAMDTEDISVNIRDYKSAHLRVFEGTSFEAVTVGVAVFPDYRSRGLMDDIIRSTGEGIVAPRIGYESVVLKNDKTYTIFFAKKNVIVALVVEEADSKQQALDLVRVMANRI